MTGRSRLIMSDKHSSSPNLIFGYHPIREALLGEKNRVEKIFVSQGRHDSRFGEILDLARSRGIPVTRFASPLFQKIFQTKGVQSFVAQVSTITFVDPDELLQRESGLFLVIDEIIDPRNMGSIFRSAAAVGVDGIFIPFRHSAPISATVEKTSAGAINLVRTARVGNLVNLAKELNDRSIQTVALVPGVTLSYLDADYTLPTAFIVGGEEKGVRRLLRETCRTLVSIPMAGHLQSLNVSVATAIVLYEALRQRRIAEMKHS